MPVRARPIPVRVISGPSDGGFGSPEILRQDGGFAEGLDTPVPQDAKALLNELAS
jgi:hypothetical protein